MSERDSELSQGQRVAAAGAAIALVTLVVVIDVLATGLVLLAWVLLGPFLAAAFLPPRTTAWIGAYAIVAAAILGWVDDIAGTSRHLVGVTIVAVVSVGAVWLSARRRQRDVELAETLPQAEEGRRLALALEAGRMGTWSWDTTAGRIDYDDGMAALYGRPPGGLPSTLPGWLDLLEPEGGGFERFARVIDTDDRFRLEHRARWPDGSVHWLHSVGEVRRDADGRVTGAIGVTADADDIRRAEAIEREARERAEHAVEMLSRIHELTDDALSRLPLDELLDALPDRLARLLDCDMVRVLLLDDDARCLHVAASYGFLGDYPAVPIPLGRGFEGRIAAANAPMVLDDLSELDIVSPALRAEVRSAAGVPMWTDTLIGVIDVGHRTSRHFQPDEVRLLQLAGERVARAIEGSRIFELERTARERSDYLARVQHALTRSMELRELMAEVTRAAVPRLGDWCSLLVLDPAEGPIIEVAHTDPEREAWAREMRRRYPYDPASPSGPAAVIRTGRSLFLPDVDEGVLAVATEHEEVREVLRAMQMRSLMTVPLRAGVETLGTLTLVRSAPGPAYTAADLQLTEDLTGRIAAAVQNALLFQQQRSIAETLQRSLLPPGLPAIPGVGVAVRYRPASGGQVGGDFYDVVTVRDGCWGVLVGDVSGKGVTAAALTGIARHTVRAGARHNLAPTEVLSWVHDAMADQAAQSNGQFCTAVYGVLDGTSERPGSFRFRFSLGGHPRPIHVPCGAKPTLVGRPGTLLGALSHPRVHESDLLLQPGDQLILYTDGATDVAGPTYLDDDHLLELVEQHLDSTAEGTVAALEDALVRRHMGAPRRDDIALLVLYIGKG